jgi:hypothetical protein
MEQQMSRSSISPAITVYDISDEQWIQRLHDRSAGRALPTRAPLELSDGEKYRWIRANRGNFAVVEALNDSTSYQGRPPGSAGEAVGV